MYEFKRGVVTLIIILENEETSNINTIADQGDGVNEQTLETGTRSLKDEKGRKRNRKFELGEEGERKIMQTLEIDETDSRFLRG